MAEKIRYADSHYWKDAVLQKVRKQREEFKDALIRLGEKAGLTKEESNTLHPYPINPLYYPPFPKGRSECREDMLRMFFELNSFIRTIQKMLLYKMECGAKKLYRLKITEDIYESYFSEHFHKVAPFITERYQCVLPSCLEGACLLELAHLSRLRTNHELNKSAMTEAHDYLDEHYWGDLFLQKVCKQREELKDALSRLAERAGLTTEESDTLHPEPMSELNYPHIPMITSENPEEMIQLFFDLNLFIREEHQRLILKTKEGKKALAQLGVSEDIYKSYFAEHFHNVAHFVTKWYQCVLPGCLESARLLELAHLSKLRTNHELERSAMTETSKYTGGVNTLSCQDAVEQLKLSEDEFHQKVIKEREDVENTLSQLALIARLDPAESATLHPDPVNVPAYPHIPVITSESKEEMIQLFFDLNLFISEVRQRLLLKMKEGEKALSRFDVNESIYKYYFDKHFYKVAPFVTNTYQCVLPGCLEGARTLELAHHSRVRTSDEIERSVLAMTEARKNLEVNTSPCPEAVEQLKLSEDEFRRKFAKERKELEDTLCQLAEKARLTPDEAISLHPDAFYKPSNSRLPQLINESRGYSMRLFMELSCFARTIRQKLQQEIVEGRNTLSRLQVPEHIYKSYFDDHFYRMVPFVSQTYQCVLPNCMRSARLLELALLSKVRAIDLIRRTSGKPCKMFPAFDVSEDPCLCYPLDSSDNNKLEDRMFLDWIRRGGRFYSSPEYHRSHSADEINVEVVNARLRILEESLSEYGEELRISGWLVGSFAGQNSGKSIQVTFDNASSNLLDSKCV